MQYLSQLKLSTAAAPHLLANALTAIAFAVMYRVTGKGKRQNHPSCRRQFAEPGFFFCIFGGALGSCQTFWVLNVPHHFLIHCQIVTLNTLYEDLVHWHPFCLHSGDHLIPYSL